ncbi:zinc finger protein 883-like isoform X2 [Plodia interpunctella]|nr:zinc finger protein 883-like isoform X2 [Plodia interpunctella]
MKTNALGKAYEELTGLTLSRSSSIPHLLCWECAQRAVSGRRLRQTARQAQQLLLAAQRRRGDILTTDSILSIDRLQNNLTSTLTHKGTTHDEFDLIIQEDDENTDIKLDAYVVLKDNVVADDIKEEINFSDNSIDERSVSPELFTAVNNIVVEPAEIKTEVTPKTKAKSDRQLGMKQKRKINKDPIKVDKLKLRGSRLDETIFEITNLNVEEQRKEIDKRKLSLNFKNSQYKCLICYKGFGEEGSYTLHMYKHSDKAGLNECDICKIRFVLARHLKKHIMDCHAQKYVCRSCPYTTTRINSAKSHENFHKGTVYCCPHCSELFQKISTYMSHVRIKHPSEFVCALCGYSFVSQKGVQMHTKLKHRLHDRTIPEDGPMCEPCGIRFQNETALEKHRLLSPKHTLKAPLIRRRGQYRTRKVDEQNGAISEGPICCEQCDEKLPNAVLYFQHFRRAHPDKNRTNFPSRVRVRPQSMCEVCGKMFQSLALLVDHSHTHTNEKQFSCAQCNKRFQRKYRLVQHLKLHQNTKKTYVCPDCGKRLSSKSNLNRHSYTHTNLRPFQCEMCGKSFKHASQRREHIQYVHMKKPWPKRNRGERQTVPQQEASDEERYQIFGGLE